MQELGHGPAVASLVLLAQQGAATVGWAAAGFAADRLGTRTIAVAGLVIAAVAAAGLAVADAPVPLVAAAATYGVAASMWRLALSARLAHALGQVRGDGEDASTALRARAYGLLVAASNAGALVSSAAVLAGLPITTAFLLQAAAMAAAAMAVALLRPTAEIRVPAPPEPGIDRSLWMLAAAMAPATAVMFQAFSGLAVVYEEDDYRRMVLLNAAVLVLAQPFARIAASRVPAGTTLAVATAGLGVGIAAAALTGWVVAPTLVWSLAELLILIVAPAVVAGLAPHRATGRYQGAFQVSQGAAAAVAMLVGPLAAGASNTVFATGALAVAVVGIAALRPLTALLATSLGHPVQCPCGALRCACDAAHAACASPSTVMVHAAARSSSKSGLPVDHSA